MIEQIGDFRKQHPLITAGVAVGALAVLGHETYKHFKEYDTGLNIFDVLGNTDQLIREQLAEEGLDVDTQYFAMGGCSAAALMNSNTEIKLDTVRIVPPSDIYKGQFRKDNGTRTDFDILARSSDEKVVNAIRRALTPNKKIIKNGSYEEQQRELSKPGNYVKIGVTGLKPAGEYYNEPQSFKESLVSLMGKDWVSHRLHYDTGRESWAIADVEVSLPDEYFEPWHLELGDGNCLPVLHPITQVLCYAARASHGIRPRDIEKVTAMMENIRDIFGVDLEWGANKQTATLVEYMTLPKGPAAALEFVDAKNALRWQHTKERMHRSEAALLAARIAVHRQLDTRKFFVQFGQGGPIFDRVLSKFSGEKQGALYKKPAPPKRG